LIRLMGFSPGFWNMEAVVNSVTNSTTLVIAFWPGAADTITPTTIGVALARQLVWIDAGVHIGGTGANSGIPIYFTEGWVEIYGHARFYKDASRASSGSPLISLTVSTGVLGRFVLECDYIEERVSIYGGGSDAAEPVSITGDSIEVFIRCRAIDSFTHACVAVYDVGELHLDVDKMIMHGGGDGIIMFNGTTLPSKTFVHVGQLMVESVVIDGSNPNSFGIKISATGTYAENHISVDSVIAPTGVGQAAPGAGNTYIHADHIESNDASGSGVPVLLGAGMEVIGATVKSNSASQHAVSLYQSGGWLSGCTLIPGSSGDCIHGTYTVNLKLPSFATRAKDSNTTLGPDTSTARLIVNSGFA
jgi:hypothetical protein